MTPVTRTNALVSFWNEARLRADQAKSTSVRPAPGVVPWRAALEDVLKIGYGVQTQSRFVDGAWELVRWRTVPSAGALYPCEVIVSVVGEGNYLWDLDRGRLVACGMAPLTRDDLAAAGIVTAPGQRLEALLILVARPWLSMKKYHRRGYPYCHLDVGHVAANLAVYTSALGHSSTLHLRFSRHRPGRASEARRPVPGAPGRALFHQRRARPGSPPAAAPAPPRSRAETSRRPATGRS